MYKGSKANNLIKLSKAGFVVPDFFICNETWSKKEVEKKINEVLSDTKLFAIRSSCQTEDTKTQSNAGKYYSALAVPIESVYEEIQKVSDSFAGSEGDVIVQAFIPSDVAGVAFSSLAGMSISIVNSNFGLCTTVVGGKACDEYIVSPDRSTIHRSISTSKEAVFYKKRFLRKKIGRESLTKQQLMEVIALANEVEREFDYPQDIEWCIYRDKLYILQARPITRNIDIGRITYYDSANIAESYTGIVLPLTCSFASFVYERVYRDLLRMSGVSKKKIEDHTHIFENLLGFIKGRMYYNMNNWYRMSKFIPGHEQNKENFELMISSNVKEKVDSNISPPWILRLVYPLLLIFKTLFFGITKRWFRFKVSKHLKKFQNINYHNLSIDECVKVFAELDKKLLRRWYVTVENDFFVMTYYGLLINILGKEQIQNFISFPSKGTGQISAIKDLSLSAQKKKKLWQTVIEGDYSAFMKIASRYDDFIVQLENYYELYGGRLANELKLESPGIYANPDKLLELLRIYSDYQQNHSFTNKNIPNLSLFQRFLLWVIGGKFKKYAQQREEFRLMRSTAYSIVRRLARAVGSRLVEKNKLDMVDDVFYLKIEEVFSAKENFKNHLKEIVSKRKQDYKEYEKVSPPKHFMQIGNRDPDFFSNIKDDSLSSGSPASAGTVSGRVRVFKSFEMPDKIDFDILVTSHTDPGWTSLIGLSKGLIIEHGGVLSHAAIVARELGIPAVIGVNNAVNCLEDGDEVKIDGSTGEVKLLSS